MLHFKTFKTTLLSAIFKQFGNCFGLFDIARKSQYTYIVVNIKLIGKRLSFLNDSKARANKLYTFRQCTYIVLLCICLYIYIYHFFFQNMQLRLILTREADYVNIWLAANISDGTNITMTFCK